MEHNISTEMTVVPESSILAHLILNSEKSMYKEVTKYTSLVDEAGAEVYACIDSTDNVDKNNKHVQSLLEQTKGSMVGIVISKKLTSRVNDLFKYAVDLDKWFIDDYVTDREEMINLADKLKEDLNDVAFRKLMYVIQTADEFLKNILPTKTMTVEDNNGTMNQLQLTEEVGCYYTDILAEKIYLSNLKPGSIIENESIVDKLNKIYDDPYTCFHMYRHISIFTDGYSDTFYGHDVYRKPDGKYVLAR